MNDTATPPDARTFAHQVLHALNGAGLSHIEAHIFEALVPESLVDVMRGFLEEVRSIGVTDDDFASLPLFVVQALVAAMQDKTKTSRDYIGALSFHLALLVNQIRRTKRFQRSRDQALQMPRHLARPPVDFGVKALERTLTQRGTDTVWKDPKFAPTADRPIHEIDPRKDHHAKSAQARLHHEAKYVQGKGTQDKIDALTRIAGFHATDLLAEDSV